MASVENESNKKSIWAKVGGVVKTGGKVVGRVLLLVPKAIIYTAKNPFTRLGKAKHDAKVAIKEAVGMEVPKEEKKYLPPVELTQDSKDFGIQIIGYKDEKVTFLASITLAGDIPHINDEHMKRLEEFNKNVHINRERNEVKITIDVEKIISDIKVDSKSKGKSEGEIRALAIEGIKKEVDCNLKGIAQITGGQFKRHKDLQLLYGIAQKLYKEHDNKKEDPAESSETAKPVGSNLSEEVISRASAPFVKSCKTVRSAGDKSNESGDPRVNRPKRTTSIGF